MKETMAHSPDLGPTCGASAISWTLGFKVGLGSTAGRACIRPHPSGFQKLRWRTSVPSRPRCAATCSTTYSKSSLSIQHSDVFCDKSALG